jgi:hypothetical protein
MIKVYEKIQKKVAGDYACDPRVWRNPVNDRTTLRLWILIHPLPKLPMPII